MEQPANAFEPVLVKTSHEEIPRETITYWRDAWRRLKMNKLAMLGLIVLILCSIIALIGPFFSKYTYSGQNLSQTYMPPSVEHLMGTDKLGRDLFIRVLYGARISLSVGILAALIQATIGVVYGGLAGFLGGRTDNFMMRLVDILYSIPFTLIVILFMVVLGPGFINIILALGLVYWLPMARIVRGQILSLKEQEYVLAAKTLGAGKTRILFKHLVPNVLGPIIVTMTLAVPEAMFTEAFLSFIGLGVSAPMASWGSLTSDALTSLQAYPYLLFFPAAAISITMLALNFLGDGLQDALDPRQRR